MTDGGRRAVVSVVSCLLKDPADREELGLGPTICSPIGNPDLLNPAGTLKAGTPVTVMSQHERIQARYDGISSALMRNGYS